MARAPSPTARSGLNNGVRTHSLSALSSLSTAEAMVDANARADRVLNDSIWDSPLFVSAFAAEPKAGQPEPESSFPEFRPDDTGWVRRRQTDRTVNFDAPFDESETARSPLVEQFADALARDIASRVRESLAHAIDADALDRCVRRARDRVADDDADDATRRSTPSRRRLSPSREDDAPPPPKETSTKKDDDIRATLANMVSRLSTLEGRQRALQGKMAKLDAASGGDASQMSLAIADLQRRPVLDDAELGSLRGQVIALAHSIDKLDERTAAIERRLQHQPTTVTIDGFGTAHSNKHHPPQPNRSISHAPGPDNLHQHYYNHPRATNHYYAPAPGPTVSPAKHNMRPAPPRQPHLPTDARSS